MQHNPPYIRPKDAMPKHEAILASIDEALEPPLIGVTAEHFRTLEEEKIVEMIGSIGLWQTEQEAFDAYMKWKSGYQII